MNILYLPCFEVTSAFTFRMHVLCLCWGLAQSVWRLATSWRVRGSNPGGGMIFRTPHNFSVAHLSSFTMCKKVKVKWSRYRPGVAQREGRGIALLFHDPGTRRGWVVSSTSRPQFTPGKDPVPIVQEAGWAPRPVWTGGKSRPHRDSIPDRPVRSSVAIQTELPGPPFTLGTRSFPGVKRPGRSVDHPPLSSAEIEGSVELHIRSISETSWPVIGWTLIKWGILYHG